MYFSLKLKPGGEQSEGVVGLRQLAKADIPKLSFLLEQQVVVLPNAFLGSTLPTGALFSCAIAVCVCVLQAFHSLCLVLSVPCLPCRINLSLR